MVYYYCTGRPIYTGSIGCELVGTAVGSGEGEQQIYKQEEVVMTALLIILLWALLVTWLIFVIKCARKESMLTAVYKAYNVYGRITAYIALSFAGGGIWGVITSIIGIFNKDWGGDFISSLVVAAIGIFMYIRAYKKCPTHLKKKCILSMIMSGVGVAIKIVLFFLPGIWSLASVDTGNAADSAGGIPETIRDENGNICRTRVDGNYIYIQRPDGSESCVLREDFENSSGNYHNFGDAGSYYTN